MHGGLILIGKESFSPDELHFLNRFLEKDGFQKNGVRGICAKVTKGHIEGFEELLKWRFDPETYRIPCWIWGNGIALFDSILWPRNRLDNVQLQWSAASFSSWIEQISAFKPVKLDFNISFDGKLEHVSALEVVMSLGLYNSSGLLSAVRGDGANAKFKIEKGYLTKAVSRHIVGVDALYDFLSWREGVFIWEPGLLAGFSGGDQIPDPLPVLAILEDYHSLIKENVHIFKIIDSFKTMIELKTSHCALDDPADPFFDHYKVICTMLSKQIMSIDALLEASTASPARTLFFVNRIISLGDATPLAVSQTDHTTYVASIDTAVNEPPPRPYRVLIVDDAPFFLKVLTRLVGRDERFDVVATARDGIECLEALEAYDLDVITLDLEMPRMDGLSALKRIMIQNPKPVVVLSAFTTESSKMTYDAFKFGAIDVIEKPKNFSLQEMELNTKEILNRLARAAQVQLDEVRYIRKSHGESSKNKVNGVREESGIGDTATLEGLFINVFGAGSFSHFIKMLFLIDSLDWEATMVSILPVRFEALRELVTYIKMDCQGDIELVNETPIILKNKCHYICAQDRLCVISRQNDALAIGFKPGCSENISVSRTDVLLNLINSAWDVFGSRTVVSGISGNEEDAEVFEQCTRREMAVFYLRADKCLYPGLSIKLQERGIGIKAEGLEDLIRSWRNIKNSWFR